MQEGKLSEPSNSFYKGLQLDWFHADPDLSSPLISVLRRSSDRSAQQRYRGSSCDQIGRWRYSSTSWKQTEWVPVPLGARILNATEHPLMASAYFYSAATGGGWKTGAKSCNGGAPPQILPRRPGILDPCWRKAVACTILFPVGTYRRCGKFKSWLSYRYRSGSFKVASTLNPCHDRLERRQTAGAANAAAAIKKWAFHDTPSG